ncbi:hypothetical protein LTR35_015962 [Friedmanniomyces endolithicus]|nr:hypothetical protein LTR35_015962 [Friedmanniomyces endolithicus]KAK0269061.1 hypothetical protein LTS00_017395 [Friedmanniomyces endolithicus]KAK0972368.1 hypothetical protein LTR54_017589 [Friedmanniomyces endolithicus]
MSSLFSKLKGAVHDAKSSMKPKEDQGQVQANAQPGKQTHLHTHNSGVCSDGDSHHLHRFQSFAPQREGNDAKWYVDGCGYFWAVSVALEQARESIWILDWWLSPELYLRRPPAQNEQYRLDKMLFNAAHRGVIINVIVYKEVTQALTLSSSHTKHWLEDNDPTGNIKVLRHPDHLPDKTTIVSNVLHSIKDAGLNAAKLSALPKDALKGIYGITDDSILYWAHHEKLLIVDGQVGFMGGLDMCFGRWDTNHHSIADAHPGDLNRIVFPGQDYNNARIMDFSDVKNYQSNKLSRNYNSRMGWTDVSMCLRGPVVEDLKQHFASRWGYVYWDKYDVRGNSRYLPITYHPNRAGIIGHPYVPSELGAPVEGEGQSHHLRERMKEQYDRSHARLQEERAEMHRHQSTVEQSFPPGPLGGVQVQLMRSCTKWSHGVSLEHSIANAYIDTIANSAHFVYIENQFFITATGDQQMPVENRIGAAIVERIVRAARNNEPYQMIVNIPAIPGFAGDLHGDGALGTRAIMEYQYNSINRGGHSILESIAAQGVDPMQYIRFYNLRNYDRLNNSNTMARVEQQSGVAYDDARRGHDQQYGQVTDPQKYGQYYADPNSNADAYGRYQQAAQNVSDGGGRWDSVAECYMLGGEDIRNVPWDGDAQSEFDAFVSEELYIHTKLLIADDRVVICGSANLNDRSQLGSHDSEIAVLIEDVQRSTATWPHMDRPDSNFMPVGRDPNSYDWGSREDHAVMDPLSPQFRDLWQGTAATNTAAFAKAFHPIPSDQARNWQQYDEFYERYFKPEEPTAAEKKVSAGARPSTWKYGHVVAEEFSPGEQGLRELKEVLSRIRGSLVEMPLMFLKEETILAQEAMGLNELTEVLYT